MKDFPKLYEYYITILAAGIVLKVSLVEPQSDFHKRVYALLLSKIMN